MDQEEERKGIVVLVVVIVDRNGDGADRNFGKNTRLQVEKLAPKIVESGRSDRSSLMLSR